MSKDYGDYVIAGMHVHGTLSDLQFASEVDVAAGATTVVADVVSFEPGILSTEDGSTLRRSTLVFTPVVVQVSEVVRGGASQGSATVLLEGGTAGCVTEWLDVAPRITAGTRYLLFLSPAYAADFKTLLGPLQIQFAWPVGADDVVQTPSGPMPLADLIATIRKLPSPTPGSSARP
jgi:hypothetical protein